MDLVNLNQLKLSSDKKTLAVGPGNRWLDVYSFLTPHNLAVVGGRVSSSTGLGMIDRKLMNGRLHLSVSVA